MNFTLLALIQQCSDIDLTINYLTKKVWLLYHFGFQFIFKLFTFVYDLQFETFSLKRLNFKDIIINLNFPFLENGLVFFLCLINVLIIQCIKVCHLKNSLAKIRIKICHQSFVNCPGVELFYLGINVLSILTQNDYCKVIDLDQNQINIKTWTAWS